MRSWSPVVISVSIGLGGLTAPGRVAAQPPGADAAPAASGGDPALRTVEARRRYQEGNAAMKLHQWQRAHEAYLEAWRQRPHWQVAGSLGEVELELGLYKDAAMHLSLFLREAQDVPPVERKRVSEWLSRARAQVATVTITAAPPGADIVIDGVAIGQAPLRDEVYVEPGKHLVTSRLGQCSGTEAVDLVAGQAKEIALRCAAPTPAPSVAVPAPVAVPAAPIESERYATKRKAIVIAGASVALASMGLGITSVALFTAKGSKARESHEPASGPNATAEASFKSVALWSFVAAGLVGGGALVYEITSKRPSRPPVKGSLVMSPSGGAAMIQGEF